MPDTAIARAAFRRILLRSVFVPVIVMTVLALALIVQVRQLTAASAMLEHTDEVISRLYQLEATFISMQANLRGYLLGLDASLGLYERSRDAVPRMIADLRELTSDRGEARLHLGELEALRARWLAYAARRIEGKHAGSTPPVADVEVGHETMLAVRGVFERFIDEEMNLRRERNAHTRAVARWTIVGAGGLTVLFGVLLSLLSRGQLRWLSSTYENSLARARDLSEQLERRVEHRTRELQGANERLNDANRELEAFAYSISHDLRAPMRHISGFANLLKMSPDAKLSADDVEHLDTIHRTAVLAGRMVDDLLAFSRIGRTQMRADVVDVDALVATCIRELAPELRGRRVEWSIAPLPPTHGDASLLKLAFQNLLANAVKYTGTRAVAHVEVGARAEDGGTTYFVKDDGVGFDMAYAHKLFGVFQRLHRAEDFEGTGIGLANVRRIIVRHGGKAWAEGVPDAGATFHVHLPAREASGTETASTPRDDIDER